jgi:hypothetical protein
MPDKGGACRGVAAAVAAASIAAGIDNRRVKDCNRLAGSCHLMESVATGAQ